MRLAEDPWLDDAHFAVTALDDGFLVRDLGSARGTMVGGARLATETRVTEGAEIVAGCTTFVIQRAARAATTLGDARAERAGEIVRALPGRLYAVLDSARSVDVLRYRRELPEASTCLYEGPTALRLADAAPYLFELDRAGALLTTLLEDGWGDGRGIFLHTPARLDEVRRHLRTLVYARMPSEAVVFFRFYDPRVLGPILPGISPRQIAALFGPIRGFLVESHDGDELLLAERPESGAVTTRAVSLRD
jgi:hypothetical protein